MKPFLSGLLHVYLQLYYLNDSKCQRRTHYLHRVLFIYIPSPAGGFVLSWTRHSLLSTWTRNVEERNFFFFFFLFYLFIRLLDRVYLYRLVYKLQQCPVSGKSLRKLPSTSVTAFKEQTKRENGSKGAANGQTKKKKNQLGSLLHYQKERLGQHRIRKQNISNVYTHTHKGMSPAAAC